jgi:hypothetical protein
MKKLLIFTLFLSLLLGACAVKATLDSLSIERNASYGVGGDGRRNAPDAAG